VARARSRGRDDSEWSVVDMPDVTVFALSLSLTIDRGERRE